MKKLIIIITGSLIMLSSCQESTQTQDAIQDPVNSVDTTGHTDTIVDKQSINNTIQQSNQIVEPTDTLATVVSVPWNGKYSAYFSYGDIAGQNAGWALEITITNNKITAKGEGFQMAFVDELSAKTSGSKLILTHLKNVSGYSRGKKMNPEFTLSNDHGKFYIQSEWIDSDVTNKPAALGYRIDRTDF